jgi:acetyl-CoA/propionyl-CoA carboxylase biotin carboxyl carrier protein
VAGVPTVIPFHRAVLDDSAFAAPDGTSFSVHTQWIETEFSTQFQPHGVITELPDPAPRQTVVVEVAGRRLEVSLPGDLALRGGGATRAATPRRRGGRPAAMKMENPVIAHRAGTITRLAAQAGTPVTRGTVICTISS